MKGCVNKLWKDPRENYYIGCIYKRMIMIFFSFFSCRFLTTFLTTFLPTFKTTFGHFWRLIGPNFCLLPLCFSFLEWFVYPPFLLILLQRKLYNFMKKLSFPTLTAAKNPEFKIRIERGCVTIFANIAINKNKPSQWYSDFSDLRNKTAYFNGFGVLKSAQFFYGNGKKISNSKRTYFNAEFNLNFLKRVDFVEVQTTEKTGSKFLLEILMWRTFFWLFSKLWSFLKELCSIWN